MEGRELVADLLVATDVLSVEGCRELLGRMMLDGLELGRLVPFKTVVDLASQINSSLKLTFLLELLDVRDSLFPLKLKLVEETDAKLVLG